MHGRSLWHFTPLGSPHSVKAKALLTRAHGRPGKEYNKMNAGAGGQSKRGAANLISSRRKAKADTEANTISPLRDTHTHTHPHTRRDTVTTLVTSPQRCPVTHWEQGEASGWFAARYSRRSGSLQGSAWRETVGRLNILFNTSRGRKKKIQLFKEHRFAFLTSWVIGTLKNSINAAA